MRILIVILSFVNTSLFSNECENGFIEINNYCYFEQDIQVLNQIIFNSNLNINPTSLGEQVWDNGRLLSLCYSMYEIDGCLQSIPLSKTNPEDVDTHAQDHAYDALRYLIMSRPRMSDPISDIIRLKQRTFEASDSTFGY